MSLLRPPPLHPGDQVAVVAPAGPFGRSIFEKGLSVLASRYQPVFTERLFESHRYLAGKDESRAVELQKAFDDEHIRAVFTARGGYGSMRLLPQLRLTTPKLLVGFSDVTALHLAVQRQGWCSVHGPVLTQLGTQPPEVIERFFQVLEGQPVAPLSGRRTIWPGIAEGPLLGGNLSVLTRLIGTPWFPELSGCVLLLEDVGERPYRIDRMWTHLKLAGVLAGVRGIVLGDFTACDESGGDFALPDVLDDLTAELKVPCAAGFQIGHGAINMPLMLGSSVRLDADKKTLSSGSP